MTNPLPLDVPPLSLPEYFLHRISGYSSRSALVCAASGRSITFGELAAKVRAFAGALQADGLQPGDVVALWAANDVDYPVAFHGAMLAGAVVTPIGSMATDDDVLRQLEDSCARWLIAGEELVERAAVVAARVQPAASVLSLGAGNGPGSMAAACVRGIAPVPVAIDAERDVAALPYSSGTTGAPKGVMLTHRNLVANLLQAEHGETLGESDVAIGVLPFAHIYGLTVVMNMTLIRGTPLVVVPRFDPPGFLKALQDHRVSRAYLAPPLVLFLAKHPLVAQFDLSRLRTIISGAAPLEAALAKECALRIGSHVIQGYGLTETSPAITRDVLDPAASRPGSIGPLVPGTQARLVDPATGQDVADGLPGELWVRGPQVMKGYLNRPDATRDMVDAQGWLHTGDLATRDADGWLTVTDRLKELIKYKGYQVAPSELEAVLLQHANVRDCAVIGKTDAEAGEIPKALVVVAQPTDAQALLDFVAARVAPYKKLRELEFIDAIPKSPAGKILRRVLVQRERQLSTG